MPRSGLDTFASFALLLLVLGGCGSYKQNLMLRPPEGYAGKTIDKNLLEAEKNYTIQANDNLKLEVFSSKGERIIDPDGELLKNQATQQSLQLRSQPTYLVNLDGTVKFPMIDTVSLVGLTIRQAEAVLQKAYNNYYKECYVLLTFGNKRVTVLGSVGGQVIPLLNENMKLSEVLALSKGIGNDGKAHNIRVVRGSDVYLLDLSTIDGFLKNNMLMQSGDIVYVEPVRRPLPEGFRDIAPIISLVFSVTTLILVFINSNNNNN